jgi:hypothetical protein
MKKCILILYVCVFCSCSLFKSNKPGSAIGAEKIMIYGQPGYKPKNKKERAEQAAVLKQMKEDEKAAKKIQEQ